MCSSHVIHQQLAAALRLTHPIDLLHKLPIEPAQPAGHLALLQHALAPERGGDVPERMVCDVAREADQRARGGRPVRVGGAVGADDALGKLGHEWVRESLGAPLPDVRAAVGRGGDAPRGGAAEDDARGE